MFNLADMIKAGGDNVILRAKVGDFAGSHLYFGQLRKGDGPIFTLDMPTVDEIVNLLFKNSDHLEINGKRVSKEEARTKLDREFGMSINYWKSWGSRQFDDQGVYAVLGTTVVDKVEVMGIDNVTKGCGNPLGTLTGESGVCVKLRRLGWVVGLVDRPAHHKS